MKQSPSSFVFGVLLGVIAVFLGIIALRETPSAFAQGVDNQGGVVVGMGGSQQGTNDMMFVLNNLGERKVIAAYRVTNKGYLALVSTREITWDLKVPELNNGDKAYSVIAIKSMVEKVEKEAADRAAKDAAKGAKAPGAPGADNPKQ